MSNLRPILKNPLFSRTGKFKDDLTHKARKMNPDIYIETERLILRPFTRGDIGPSFEMNRDAEVTKYTGDGGVVSFDEIERRIVENVFGDYEKYGFGRLAVEVKGENKFIGFAGLKYLSDLDEVDIGYRFMKEYWGRGFATESGRACLELGLEQLGLERIIGMVLPENTGSINVLKKLDFKYEKDILEEGELVNIYALEKRAM